MVATWNPAAAADYYTRQTAYYTAGGEPAGRWYAPARSFSLVDGATVDNTLFERLFTATDETGASLLTNSRGRLDRTPAFDVTLSAPRSVSLLWALGDAETSDAIEAAQAAAVRRTLDMLEREAIRARRGRGGGRIEAVPLTAAIFRHGESRPAAHEDGQVFGDPNLHTHCVILNLAPRADGTIGALHSKVLRDWKMAAGAAYHAALAAELQAVGFRIDRVGRNGVFEIAGIEDRAIRFFSARRREIEAELAEAGGVGIDAAQAAVIARTTRGAKPLPGGEPREAIWRRAARSIGFEIAPIVERSRAAEPVKAQGILAQRLDALPDALMQTTSVIDRRELVRSVAEMLVGTSLDASHIVPLVNGLIQGGVVVEVGHDALGQPRYSTPEMIRVERELVEVAARLAARDNPGIASEAVRLRCRDHGLRPEQIQAALHATSDGALAIIEGAPGTGKTKLLRPIVQSWQVEGFRVIGTASAWRVANTLRDDLGIEARATASWMAQAEADRPFLDRDTVLIVDEAGLLSSKEMHTLLNAADRASAKVMLVGDRNQLQAIGAGSGLALAARAAEVARIGTIVRQREEWAREAVIAFGRGDAEAALKAHAVHGQFVEVDGPMAAIRAAVDRIEADIIRSEPGSALILTRTNAEAAMVGREVRTRLRNRGLIAKEEVTIDAVTPSGHRNEIFVGIGERVRFLARLDAIGVVNGSVGVVTQVSPNGSDAGAGTRHARIEARVDGRLVRFDTRDIADEQGRTRLGWAYASTVYGAQGMTVDRAAVLLTPAFNRHDIYVAASRARDATALVLDRRAVDRHIQGEGNDGPPASRTTFTEDERRTWLAAQLSRANVKETTIDVIEQTAVAVASGHDRRRAPVVDALRIPVGMERRYSYVREAGFEL